MEWNLSKTSKIIESYLPDLLIEYATKHFDDLYKHRPEKYGVVLVGHDKEEKTCDRSFKSYLKTPPLDDSCSKSYMFSGKDQSANQEDLPEKFKPFLDYMKTINPNYNQVVVNYYSGGKEYIPLHSDCELGMISGADIAMINLDNSNSQEEHRIFQLKRTEARKDVSIQQLGILLKHGMILQMCGDTQKQYKHGVNKDSTTYKRISITFRQFK
jgi:alkylated DNA repair dioxygenase AlkB